MYMHVHSYTKKVIWRALFKNDSGIFPRQVNIFGLDFVLRCKGFFYTYLTWIFSYRNTEIPAFCV